jgi:hypothetical protein
MAEVGAGRHSDLPPKFKISLEFKGMAMGTASLLFFYTENT